MTFHTLTNILTSLQGQPKPNIGSVKFYIDNLKSLVDKLKSENGKNIFCDGGAEIVNELLKDDLIDEFIISVIPILVW